MYGVPADLDLSRFKNATLIQLRVGQFDVQFCFENRTTVSVEGKWELWDATGSLVDATKPNRERTALYLHILLGRRVCEWSLDAPRSFSLKFDSGHLLTIFDESRDYESFSIQPGDIFV